MPRRILLCLLLIAVLILAACGGDTNPDGDPNQAQGGLLGWDRSPNVAIVRLDTGGRTGEVATDMNELPFCVLYGDGRVVWLSQNVSPEEVYEARIDDQAFRSFLEYVITSGFYSWTEDEGFIVPTPELEFAQPAPLLETITVTLYGETRQLDALSNWPPGAFDNILERCRTLSDSPTLFVPQGVWLSALALPMRSDIPSLPWTLYETNYPNLDLASIPPESPMWAEGGLATLAWQTAREGMVQITDGGTAYRLIAQVPYLHEDAPPPPDGQTDGAPSDEAQQDQGQDSGTDNSAAGEEGGS